MCIRDRLAANPYLLATSPPDSGPSLLSDELLARLLKQLHSACDVDFVHYKRGTLERRIARRVALQDATSAEAYLELLQTDAAEAHALRANLLIKYTRSFRDPEAFEALTDTVFP